MAAPEQSQQTASLVKRLAGPSTGKAGLAIDQTEINRIIAEASKGSKYYENEKKKDKDLTERIARILKQRDDVMKGADIAKVEAAVDRLLEEIEAQRDLSQIIVHVDMDAFFANVELLHNPELAGKAFGVGHGVLTTASYEARKYGVRSGMAGFIAKKLCPDLIQLDINPSRYQEMSTKVMVVFKRYDSNMCPAGCDEGYLNITQYCAAHCLTPDECVKEMRETVHRETNLTVSAGIAPNKMLAKICSDKNKPNGQFHLPFDSKSIIAFMHDLSIRKVPGIGRVNERLLESIGIKTCGDIYTHRATLSLMGKQFGLKFLLRTHLGIASNTVQPSERHERKSIGAERTFNPLSDRVKILEKLDEVAAELENDMESNGWTGRTVTLKFKLDTYQVFTRAKSFDRWITKKADLFATGKELLIPELPMKLRLIGLRVTKLKDLRAPQEPAGGIKRFFEPIKNKDRDTDSESPRKRRKLDDGFVSTDADADGELEGLDEDAMPGFHEHEEDDTDLSQSQSQDIDSHDVDEEPDYLTPIPKTDASTPAHEEVSSKPNPRPRPPVSAPATSSQGNVASTSSLSPVAHSKMRTKPRSTSATTKQRANSPSSSTLGVPTIKPDSASKAGTTSQSHSCPICGKELQTDNQGLNEHIDFCLSRGAIREAQAQASTTTSPGTRRKPNSAIVASAPRATMMKNKPSGGKPQRKGR